MFAKPRLCPIFSILFISSISFSMENPLSDKKNEKEIPRKVSFFPLDNAFTSQNNNQNFSDISNQFLLKMEDFDEESISNMNYFFDNAPVEVQNIVRHLKNRNFLCDGSYRASIFVGIPGSGKTTTAQAIGYKMVREENWKFIFIPSTTVLKDYRNQTAVFLNKIFKDIISKKEPCFMVIDELNELLENFNSEHHDSSATSKAIWSFLDSRKNKHDFFFIGTMNRANLLPKPFKSRILFKCLEFTSIDSIDRKNQILRRNLICPFVQLDKNITDNILNTEIQKIHHCTARDLEEFASALKRSFRNHDNKSIIMIIDKTHIDEVMNKYLKTYTFVDYDKIEETAEERADRYHQENKTLQTQFHQNNKDMQEQHFVQQYWGQQIPLPEDRIDRVLTPSQKQIAANIANQNPNNSCTIQ